MYGPSTTIQLQTEHLINPLYTQLNPIPHLLALLAAHHIFHIRGLTVKTCKQNFTTTRYLQNKSPEVFYNAICAGWSVNDEFKGFQKQDFLLRSITELSVWTAMP